MKNEVLLLDAESYWGEIAQNKATALLGLNFSIKSQLIATWIRAMSKCSFLRMANIETFALPLTAKTYLVKLRDELVLNFILHDC